MTDAYGAQGMTHAYEAQGMTHAAEAQGRKDAYEAQCGTHRCGTHAYDDILGLPHHQSKTRPQMSMHDRAAQFAPFAALTGYGETVNKAGCDYAASAEELRELWLEDGTADDL